MTVISALPPGTMVIVTADFGPIIRGQLGMVADRPHIGRLSWRGREYVCVFLGGITVTVSGWQITRYEHGCSPELLANPLWFLQTRRAQQPNNGFSAELRRSHH